MGCSYYEYKSTGWLSGEYFCHKKQDKVNSDVADRYCKGYSYSDCPIYKGKNETNGCFLTSACVFAKNLPDDCEELTILRNFRDDWLKQQPGGCSDIEEYYAIAPKIVSSINACSDSARIWEELYYELVLPCVEFIKNGEMELAYRLYLSTTRKLAADYI